MIREEAIIYFNKSNINIISVCKDENKYDYEKQEIISDCARKTYEANKLAIEALEQEPCREFAKWVAEEVIDEELWELNYGAFAELACRKLEKLGIVRAKGDEWELDESQESEEV